MNELVEAVKRYARANYEKDGWDYIVETWTDEELADLLRGCKTERGAIRVAKAEVAPRAAYRAEIQAEVF